MRYQEDIWQIRKTQTQNGSISQNDYVRQLAREEESNKSWTSTMLRNRITKKTEHSRSILNSDEKVVKQNPRYVNKTPSPKLHDCLKLSS